MLFLRVQLARRQYWLGLWLGAIQTTSHYLNQWWPISLATFGVTKPRCQHCRRWSPSFWLYFPLLNISEVLSTSLHQNNFSVQFQKAFIYTQLHIDIQAYGFGRTILQHTSFLVIIWRSYLSRDGNAYLERWLLYWDGAHNSTIQ